MKSLVFLIVTLTLSLTVKISSQWSTDMRITFDTSNSNNPFVFVSGSNIHVVFEDTRDGNIEIYYKCSTNEGLNWGNDIRLTNHSGYSYNPVVKAAGTNVHVVWRDSRNMGSQVYYKRSTDNGLSWSSDSGLTFSNNANTPYMDVDGTLVSVVWEDYRNGNNEIYYRCSVNGGLNWGNEIRITNNINNSIRPNLKVSSMNVFLVWYDDRDGNEEIYYKFSTDAGINWGADKRLTNDPDDSKSPVISTFGMNIHVAWNSWNMYGDEIYYKQSTDGGVTWGVDKRLTYNHFSHAPFMIVSASTIHLVWQDSRNSNAEIYYLRSTDGGNSWEPETRLTNNPSWVFVGSLGVSGNVVHVIWDDNRDGHFEIYYKRNPTGNPFGIININTETPKEFSLFQNYPNPFNPYTTIRFSLPLFEGGGRRILKIIIYDILGREITQLANEKLNPGSYEIEWDASNYPSGVYYYQLTADDYSQTRKMILLK